MMLGGLYSQTRGACPSCGRDVPRRHAFVSSPASLVESYGCLRCGPTDYRVTA